MALIDTHARISTTMAKEFDVTVTPSADSTVEIKGKISWDAFAKFEQQAFARLAQHLELDGFRKGHIPEHVARAHIKDDLLLPDMAELAIQEFYPKILEEKNIDAIGRPRLSITKLARDNELGFTITTAILPEIKLPDYKKIARAVPIEPPKDVTEENIDKVIEDLRQLRAYGHVHGKDDNHTHGEPLPEVNDEFAKSFGNFTSVAELRAKVSENLEKENTQQSKDKRRITILEKIISETSFPLPAILLQGEQEKMMAQSEMDITRSGFEMDAYLNQIGKTREQLLEEFKPEAENRARMQLIINAIAKDAHISVSDEEVQKEAERFASMYPVADKARTIAYADMVLTNEKVLSMLESEN